MKKLLCKELLFALSIFCCFFIAFSSCSDSEDESIILQLTLDSSQQSKTLFWDETEASVKFSATGPWTATVEDVTSRATVPVALGLNCPDMKVRQAKFHCPCCCRRMIAKTIGKQLLS